MARQESRLAEEAERSVSLPPLTEVGDARVWCNFIKRANNIISNYFVSDLDSVVLNNPFEGTNRLNVLTFTFSVSNFWLLKNFF